MTAAELRHILEQVPGNTPVLIENAEFGGCEHDVRARPMECYHQDKDIHRGEFELASDVPPPPGTSTFTAIVIDF